jgi:hypothetical protein
MKPNLSKIKNYPNKLKYFVIVGDPGKKKFDISVLPESVEYIYLNEFIFDVEKIPKNVKLIITQNTNSKFLKKLKKRAKINKFQVYRSVKLISDIDLRCVFENSYKLIPVTEEKISNEIEKMFLKYMK